MIKDEALKLALDALDNLLYWDNGKSDYDQAREAITAIEQALAAPVQPVAWGVFEGGNLHDMFFTKEEADNMAHLKGLHAEIRPLTTPPAAQRQWVGLTLADREKLRDQFEGWSYPAILVDAVADILKEKNT